MRKLCNLCYGLPDLYNSFILSMSSMTLSYGLPVW
ncbi:hypothetical protein BU9_CDS0064 [Klebsiella phage Kpn BU9]|nr:hypothetical protein BU9_CDS0064 [Klebsiella phage Kpn BU9]